MTKIEDGKIADGRVQRKIYAGIEHDDLSQISAIVLHRTDSLAAEGTLNAYAHGKTSGAHFLIDKSGLIYQTASMRKTCWHIGELLPRCEVEKSCDPSELKTITALIHERGLAFGLRAVNLSRHEAAKSYPLRYPSNSDSVGIEVVGKFWASAKTFEKPTLEQLRSLKWLVETIVEEYSLSLHDDVYAHGAIARKQVCEGAQLLQFLHSGAVQ